jgi:hypothetical protein
VGDDPSITKQPYTERPANADDWTIELNWKESCMVLPEGFDESLSEVIEDAHEFAVDLNYLVIANHKFTMEGIKRAEDEALTGLQDSLKYETDRDIVSSIICHEENFFDNLRVAARNLAVVGLVTRLQHWAGAYARRIDPTREAGQSVQKELSFLNSQLGAPPIETSFFLKLAEVRHSVIHADSQPRWTHLGKARSVDPRYAPNGYRVEVEDEYLEDAVAKAITQIKWYDEKLASCQN